MNGFVQIKEPHACTERERWEFARLVRQGFQGSDQRLQGRIRDAKWLAFHYATSDTLAAVAAIKVPNQGHRDDVFKKSDARIKPDDYKLELGWVFVVPAYRGNRIASDLCRLLVARVPDSGMFATTRPYNMAMIRILFAIGFARFGRPFPRRNEQLVLFLRSSRTFKTPHPTT